MSPLLLASVFFPSKFSCSFDFHLTPKLLKLYLQQAGFILSVCDLTILLLESGCQELLVIQQQIMVALEGPNVARFRHFSLEHSMKSLAFLLIIASPYFEKLHSVRRAVESFVLVKKFVHGHHPEEFGVSLSLDPFSLTEQGLLF